MIDSRIEAGKVEEEIRTSCGAGKKRKWSKIYDRSEFLIISNY